ncbi:MAG: MOSC domain-containing protein [Methyloligella sp. ZOD6]
MSEIGRIHSVWRYPVKSMRGERLAQAFLAFAGLYGDRIYAVKNAKADPGFPYHTGREQEELILYQPRFLNTDAAAEPLNRKAAEAIGPGVKPLYANRASLSVDVTTPDGETFPIADPTFIAHLKQRLGKPDEDLSVQYSETAFTDCRPVSLFSMQTVAQLASEIEDDLDPRQFRANLYADFSGEPFGENDLVGKNLKLGDKAVIAILERDPRCKMITLDPETAEQKPEILRHLTRTQGRCAGLYAATLVEGTVKPGDAITVLN